jgi:hypothetical protein
LHKHRPISLFATIHPPVDQDPNERDLLGLTILINLYKPFDDRMFAEWNEVRSSSDASWLAQVQEQLSQQVSMYLGCRESQEVEIHITKAWLQIMVWQLCVRKHFLSSTATNPVMTFDYPIEVSRELVSTLPRFSQKASEVHGVGLVSAYSLS